ncbi:hypothetical protein KCU65_g9983, partial [Aureobasidium melanogenum]
MLRRTSGDFSWYIKLPDKRVTLSANARDEFSQLILHKQYSKVDSSPTAEAAQQMRRCNAGVTFSGLWPMPFVSLNQNGTRQGNSTMTLIMQVQVTEHRQRSNSVDPSIHSS